MKRVLLIVLALFSFNAYSNNNNVANQTTEQQIADLQAHIERLEKKIAEDEAIERKTKINLFGLGFVEIDETFSLEQQKLAKNFNYEVKALKKNYKLTKQHFKIIDDNSKESLAILKSMVDNATSLVREKVITADNFTSIYLEGMRSITSLNDKVASLDKDVESLETLQAKFDELAERRKDFGS